MQRIRSNVAGRSKSGILAKPDIAAVDPSGSRQGRTLVGLESRGLAAASAATAGEPGSERQNLLIPRNSSLAYRGCMLSFIEQLPKDGGCPLTQIKPSP